MNSMMNKIFRSKGTIMVLEEVLCGFETFIKKDLGKFYKLMLFFCLCFYCGRGSETRGRPQVSLIGTKNLNKSTKRGLFVLPIKQGRFIIKSVNFRQPFNTNSFFLVSKNGLWTPNSLDFNQCFVFLFTCFVLIGKQTQIDLKSLFWVLLVCSILMQKTAHLWVVLVPWAPFYWTPDTNW